MLDVSKRLATGVCQQEIRRRTPSHKRAGEKGAVAIECDELWFVGKKENKQWVWLAMDVQTCEIVGLHVGPQEEESCWDLWDSLPDCYLNAEVYTDKYAAYAAVIHDKYHHTQGKVTQHIERFNNTLRQRVPRLTHKTLSFSKSLQNHLGAIWLFVHHYNSALLS